MHTLIINHINKSQMTHSETEACQIDNPSVLQERQKQQLAIKPLKDKLYIKDVLEQQDVNKPPPTCPQLHVKLHIKTNAAAGDTKLSLN